MAFYDEPGEGRQFAISIGYVRDPASRVYRDADTPLPTPQELCDALNPETLTAAKTHIELLEAEAVAGRAAIEKLKRMVVWAVRHAAEVEGDRMWWFRMLGEDSGDVDTECDGTPASILAAVAKAMGE